MIFPRPWHILTQFPLFARIQLLRTVGNQLKIQERGSSVFELDIPCRKWSGAWIHRCVRGGRALKSSGIQYCTLSEVPFAKLSEVLPPGLNISQQRMEHSELVESRQHSAQLYSCQWESSPPSEIADHGILCSVGMQFGILSLA